MNFTRWHIGGAPLGVEAVFDVVAVVVNPDDLAMVVDAQSIGAIRAEGIVERGVGAVAVGSVWDENYKGPRWDAASEHTESLQPMARPRFSRSSKRS